VRPDADQVDWGEMVFHKSRSSWTYKGDEADNRWRKDHRRKVQMVTRPR